MVVSGSKKTALFIAAIAFAVLSVSFLLLDAKADFKVKEGEVAEFFGLPHLLSKKGEGGLVKITNFVGEDAANPKKLLLVNFWASWCAPCKKEMPALEKLYGKYKDEGGEGKGLMVLSVCVDTDAEGLEAAKKFAQENKFSFPTLGGGYVALMLKNYFDGNINLPAMLFVDKDQKVLKAASGYSEANEEALENDVRGYLGLPPLEKKTEEKKAESEVKPADGEKKNKAEKHKNAKEKKN